jgi:predicted Zn-dependent protease
MWHDCSPREACRRAGAAALGVLLAALACGTLSIPQERKLGEDANREIRQQVKLFRDRVVHDYVAHLGAEIVAAAGPQPFEYEFHVVEDDQINAFALPAGFIYVHTETILKARNVSELAGVVGHEVGHVARRHIAQNYNRQRNTGILQQIAVIGAGVAGGSGAAGAVNLLGGVAGVAYLNTFGREAEADADAFAVDVLPRAGYDPRGLVSFFDTLAREGGSGGPSFLSSHPAPKDRIQATSARIAAARLPANLEVSDGGRLEIIQQRIRLLVGEGGSGSKR